MHKSSRRAVLQGSLAAVVCAARLIVATSELDGFNLQAAVRIEADDDEGRDLLLRSCARPCFALEPEIGIALS